MFSRRRWNRERKKGRRKKKKKVGEKLAEESEMVKKNREMKK